MEEVERIRQAALTDKRDFATIQATAIAKARGENYSQARHGPFDVKRPPRQQRKEAEAKKTEGNLSEILERFAAKKPRLRLLEPDRPQVRRVADQ